MLWCGATRRKVYYRTTTNEQLSKHCWSFSASGMRSAQGPVKILMSYTWRSSDATGMDAETTWNKRSSANTVHKYRAKCCAQHAVALNLQVLTCLFNLNLTLLLPFPSPCPLDIPIDISLIGQPTKNCFGNEEFLIMHTVEITYKKTYFIFVNNYHKQCGRRL